MGSVASTSNSTTDGSKECDCEPSQTPIAENSAATAGAAADVKVDAGPIAGAAGAAAAEVKDNPTAADVEVDPSADATAVKVGDGPSDNQSLTTGPPSSDNIIPPPPVPGADANSGGRYKKNKKRSRKNIKQISKRSKTLSKSNKNRL